MSFPNSVWKFLHLFFKYILKKTLPGSFDISCLFTNVTLHETVGICASSLVQGELVSPPRRYLFAPGQLSLASSMRYTDKGMMSPSRHRGSPLGPALASIFVGFQKDQLFGCTMITSMYNVIDVATNR